MSHWPAGPLARTMGRRYNGTEHQFVGPFVKFGRGAVDGHEGHELGATWFRPGRLKCKWRAVVGQQATLKADQYLHLPKIASLWLPKKRRSRLRAFVGEAQKSVANSDSSQVTVEYARD